MTDTHQPARRSPIRSIAVVWPHDSEAWRCYRRHRVQLERKGIIVHLVPRDQLLDTEHGRWDIDAIATIGQPLDAARRVASRRDVPYIALDCRAGALLLDAIETEPTSTPVFDVTIDNQLPLIALRSIMISTPGVAHGETSLFDASTDRPGTCRHRCRAPAVMFLDRRAVRLPPDALVTVQHGANHLREHGL